MKTLHSNLMLSKKEIVDDYLFKGSLCRLEREHENKADPNAVKVLTVKGKFAGYLERGIAARVALIMDGKQYKDNLIAEVYNYEPEENDIRLRVRELQEGERIEGGIGGFLILILLFVFGLFVWRIF